VTAVYVNHRTVLRAYENQNDELLKIVERNQTRGLIIWKKNGNGIRGDLIYCSFRAKELLGIPQTSEIADNDLLRKEAEAQFSDIENNSTQILFNETVFDLTKHSDFYLWIEESQPEPPKVTERISIDSCQELVSLDNTQT
jgi:hypothetical protein